MKTTKSLKTVCLFFTVFGWTAFGFAQKITYQLVDSATLNFKPASEKCLKAKKIYIAPVVDADSVFKNQLIIGLDMNYYTIVNSKSEADVVLIYTTSFENTTATQTPVNPTLARDKRYVPTSRETAQDHNFNSNKTAYQNSKNKYSRSSSSTTSTPKSYTYKGVTPVITKIELFDSSGNKIDESEVTEDLTLEGHSSISAGVAQKDYELVLEKSKNQVIKDHLELAMTTLSSNYFFTKAKIPVFAITVKNKQFDDWNDAVSALNSWVRVPGLNLDDPRIPIMEKIFQEQAERDYGQFKDSALLASAAFYNLAVYQYFRGQPTDTGSWLTKAQSNLVYTDDSQRLFHRNLMLALFRGL